MCMLPTTGIDNAGVPAHATRVQERACCQILNELHTAPHASELLCSCFASRWERTGLVARSVLS